MFNLYSECLERAEKIHRTKINDPWFFRYRNKLDGADQIKLDKEIESLGYNVKTAAPPKPKTTGKRTFWSEEEWDQLAEVVWEARQKDLASPITNIVNTLIPQRFPKSRQRVLQSHSLAPLMERLALKQKELLETIEKRREYEVAMSKMLSEEEVLNTLTDSEVLEHFGSRVLNLLPPEKRVEGIHPQTLLDCVETEELFKFAFMNLMANIHEQTSAMNAMLEMVTRANSPLIPKSPPPKKQLKTKSKVVISGPLPNQQSLIQNGLNGDYEVKFVDSTGHGAIPQDADYYVIWSKFTGHSLEDRIRAAAGDDRKVWRHFGGINTMISQIRKALP